MKEKLALAGALMLAGAAGTSHFWFPDLDADLVETISTEEGFRAKPYEDSRGVLTIGYGTNLAEGITRDEAEFLLENRIERTRQALRDQWEPFDDQPGNVQNALTDMAYQLGVTGALGFHKMLAALEAGQYETAAAEALASKWARETPARVKRVADAIRGSERP